MNGLAENPILLVSKNYDVSYEKWLSNIAGKQWPMTIEAVLEKALHRSHGKKLLEKHYDPARQNSHDKSVIKTTNVDQFT